MEKTAKERGGGNNNQKRIMQRRRFWVLREWVGMDRDGKERQSMERISCYVQLTTSFQTIAMIHTLPLAYHSLKISLSQTSKPRVRTIQKIACKKPFDAIKTRHTISEMSHHMRHIISFRTAISIARHHIHLVHHSISYGFSFQYLNAPRAPYFH